MILGKSAFSVISIQPQSMSTRRAYEHLSTSIVRIPPYHAEHTRPRQISQVKQHRARLVLGSETAWEPRVWYSFCTILSFVYFVNFVSDCNSRLSRITWNYSKTFSVDVWSNHDLAESVALHCQSIDYLINQSIITVFRLFSAEPTCNQTVEKQTILQYLSSPTAVNVNSSCI